MAWWHQIYPSEGAVTIAGITAPMDDVGTRFRSLWPLNSGNPSLLTDLVNLADGQLPSRFETYVGNSRIKIQPGPDLPKRIRLAHPLRQLHHHTSDSTAVKREDVAEWIDADKVQAYRATELLGIRAAGAGAVLAEAGLISMTAAPAVIAVFHESYTVSILRDRFFRTDPSADRANALDAHEEPVDLRTGFVEMPNGKVVENPPLMGGPNMDLLAGSGVTGVLADEAVASPAAQCELLIHGRPRRPASRRTTSRPGYDSWVRGGCHDA